MQETPPALPPLKPSVVQQSCTRFTSECRLRKTRTCFGLLLRCERHIALAGALLQPRSLMSLTGPPFGFCAGAPNGGPRALGRGQDGRQHAFLPQ
jgi:hypothetical protein